MSEAPWYRSRYLWSAVAVLAVVACVITAWIIKERSEQRVRANEVSAIKMLTQVCQMDFRGDIARGFWPWTCSSYPFPTNLVEVLTDKEAYNGYKFKLAVGENRENWSCVAVPVEPGVTGTRTFYVDQLAVIRFKPCTNKSDRPAGPNSPPLGE